MALELKPLHVKLNSANLQNTGNCCYNFDSILNRITIDGIMLVNLNDIVSAKWVSQQLMGTLSDSSIPKWHQISEGNDPITCTNFTQQITIKSLITKLKEISNKNVEIILYIDVADQINYAYRTKPTEYMFLQFIINIGNLFTNIVQEFNKYASMSFNYFACIQKDGFQLRCLGLKQFILSFITSSVKYISKDFANNIYLTGFRHQLNINQMTHHKNTNFIACLASGYKFISMHHLYVLKTDMLPFPPEFNTYNTQLLTFTKNIYDKKKELVTALKMIKSQAKQFIEKIINVNETTDNIIIGMNLDMEYDLQIYAGIQSIIDNLKYTPPDKKKNSATGMNPFAPIFGNGSSSSGTSTKKDDDDACVTVEFKLISILDLISDGAEINAPNSLFGSSLLQKKTVLTTYIPIHIPDNIKGPLNVASLNVLKTINMYDDMLNKGIKCKKIYVLTGMNLTFDHFKRIVDWLADKKQDGKQHKKFESKYINFELNPYLRCSIAYYNYILSVSNNLITSISSVSANASTTTKIEPFYIKNAIRHAKFYNYFNKIRKIKNKTNASHIIKQEQQDNKCCTCCKCMSRFGIEYHEYKYIPYLDDKVIDFLESATDIWIPRV